jgi:hypothetical protein
MKPYEDDVVTVGAQVLGLRKAIERLELAAAQREDPVETYLPLFEALNWIVALDDRIGAIWVPEGNKLGTAWRGRVSEGDVIIGLDWVRNVVHHQWADALQLDAVGHSLYPNSNLFPSQELHPKHEFAWVWRAVDHLPPRTPRRRRRRRQSGDVDPGRTAYQAHLEGQPAADTLREGLRACEFVAGVLEPLRPPSTSPG